MYVLNEAQKAALRRALAAANNVRPRVEYLLRVTTHSDSLQELARKLETRMTVLSTVSSNMLEVARQMESNG